jgi:hypothetical protein
VARRSILWSLTLSLAVVGSQVAHALAYRIAEPSGHERAHLLAETGHVYLRFASAGLGLAAAVVLVALIYEFRATTVEGRRARPRFWAFAAVVPATFVCQEHVERLLHDGSFPWAATFETTFIVGLALQLPFAILAYVVARALLRVVRGLAALLGGRRPVLSRARGVPPPAALEAPRTSVLGIALGPRGPPSLRSA